MISTGEEAGTRGGTQGGGVEVREPQSATCEAVEVGGVDHRPEAAEVSESGVVEQ